MRKLFLAVTIVFLSTTIGCSQTSSSKDSTKKATISFTETSHDYGTVAWGGDGTYNFVFKNTGSEPMLLTDVRTSCGCTVPVWPKEPIKPGKSDKITVKYNTRISGKFSKTITVYSSAANSPVTLKIHGTVEQRKENNK
ncbi:MAG TPA: DUF1573 domain-containing protein [Bacteroidales bacterium]|nr:DUF1573 domain-containing protein [Bacteroidales bacterium]